ncbi:InlB B-repeat-containing protein [Bifidobacterium sp. ESL0763]|uniref:leucine-rich repeat domain-containing protein n=1 Tax=Bifidobacterium sp. ESL0763 TaxID=2983227 RepID=UPI0023F63071|nr:leucine-rich repeat domain-containing protein [Bifidobacterium sp. ESL0763]MDF7663782.1 InlB B-repeat-containing protein [Bifidobacterium sp. ESL0763]
MRRLVSGVATVLAALSMLLGLAPSLASAATLDRGGVSVAEPSHGLISHGGEPRDHGLADAGSPLGGRGSGGAGGVAARDYDDCDPDYCDHSDGTTWNNPINQFFPDPVVAQAVADKLGVSVTASFTLQMGDSITSLDLNNKGVTSLDGTECLRNMTSLAAKYNNISKLPWLKMAVWSQNWKSLKSLDLAHNQLRNVHQLEYVNGLTYLSLCDNKLDDSGDLQALRGLPDGNGNYPEQTLTYLDLSINQISDISSLRNLTKLQHLFVNVNTISVLPNLSGRPWPQLVELNLGSNQLTDLTQLKYVTSVQSLALYIDKLDDSSNLAALQSCTHLRQLDLTHNNISDLGFLAPMMWLVNVYPGDNEIADMSVLARLPNLLEQPTPAWPVPLAYQRLTAPKQRARTGRPLTLDVAGMLKGGDNSSLALSDANPSAEFSSANGKATWQSVPAGGTSATVRFSEPVPFGSSGATTEFNGTVTQPYSYGFDVSFTGQDGTTLSPTQDVDEGAKATRPTVTPTPSNAGLSFMGWGVPADGASGGRGRMKVYDFDAAVTKDLTVYPLWGVRWGSGGAAGTCTMGIDTIRTCFPDTHLAAKVASTLGSSRAVTDVLTQADAESIGELDGQNSGITDLQGMQLLTKIAKCYLFNGIPVSATPNTISDLTPLSNLVSLEKLVLYDNRVTDISMLGKLTAMQYFDVGQNSISDISVLEHMPSIWYLGLQYNRISDIAPLKNLHLLRECYLEFNNLSDLEQLRDASMPNLRVLQVSDNGNLPDLNPVAHFTTLTTFSARDDNVTDITPLAGMTHMHGLELKGNSISDLTALAGMTDLRNAELYENDIADITPLEGMGRLSTLYMAHNKVSDVSPLAGLTSLTQVDLSYNAVADASGLRSLSNLNYLRINDEAITRPSVVADPDVRVESAIGVDGTHVAPTGGSMAPMDGVYDPVSGNAVWAKRAEDGTASLGFDATVSIGSASAVYSGTITQPYTVTKYAVTVDRGDGSAPTSNRVALGQPVPDPGRPSRAGYRFMGWTTDTSGNGPAVDFDTATVSGDVTLHAMWRAVSSSVPLTGRDPWVCWLLLAGALALAVLAARRTARAMRARR